MVQIQQSIDVRIGSVVRTAREQKRYSVAALADRADIPRDTLLAIELGTARASAADLFRLSKALCVELRSFFGECCSMKQANPSGMIETLRAHDGMAALIEHMHANAVDMQAA